MNLKNTIMHHITAYQNYHKEKIVTKALRTIAPIITKEKQTGC